MRRRDLLARYVDAFERYDMDSLTALLHEDAVQSMPPYELWLERARADRAPGCSGPEPAAAGPRLIPTAANGSPAFGQYRRAARTAVTSPGRSRCIEIADGRIVELSFFLDAEHLFPLFGLPLRIEA